MKRNNFRKFFVVLLSLLFVFTMTACKENSGGDDPDNPPVVNPVSDKVENPTIDWWKIVNPNGFETLYVQLTNHNKVDIDVEANAVYYTDGKKVGEVEGLYASGIAAGQEFIFWYNFGIPSGVDNVEFTFTYVEKSRYTPAKITVKKEEKTNDGVFLDFNIKDECENGIVYVVFFNGNEPVYCDWKDYVEFSDLSNEYVSFGREFTKYKIYTNFIQPFKAE